MKAVVSVYKPKDPFTTALILQNPTTEKVKGVQVKRYSDIDIIKCNFKTFGGTETTNNDLITVINTATIETWFRADITSESRFILEGKPFEVLGDPEDINMRHQFLKIRVRETKGGA